MELDIVLFGATGFVGRLTAAHLARHAPAGVRIGLAGRSPEKVRAVRDELGVPWPVLQADSDDEASLDTLARTARVVISTVGPYAERGMPLVMACARAGTDYVDLTGEVLFVRRSLAEADAVARESGARIVHSCGFDTVPSDLAVLMTAERARAEGTGTLAATTVLATFRGSVSGGTVASLRGQVADAARDRTARAVVADPHALDDAMTPQPPDLAPVAFSQVVGAWTAPFLMAPYNTRVVRRSAQLLGYGPGFGYGEAMTTGRGVRGAAAAWAVAGAVRAGIVAFAAPVLDPLFDAVLPSSGEGPSERSRAAGHFRMTAHATTSQGARYLGVVAADQDPGYDGTAVMLGESALALALGESPAGGGVLTPASALGSALIRRLAAQGFTCGTARLP